MDEKPEILDTRLIAKSRLFGIEELHLRFTNGVERTYERLRTPPIAGVMMVPLLDDDTVVMIREYGAGTESYELTLPCLLYTSPSPRDRQKSRMPSSA